MRTWRRNVLVTGRSGKREDWSGKGTVGRGKSEEGRSGRVHKVHEDLEKKWGGRGWDGEGARREGELNEN